MSSKITTVIRGWTSKASSRKDRWLRRAPKASTQAWPYPPLSEEGDDIFRLLTILPDADAAPVRCTLENVSRDLPPYEALSYAWGEPVFDSQIVLNGLPFDVTSTLYQALRSLRQEDQPRRIWVDAICINQMDDDEKARQIRQMDHIFIAADLVIAWLGESTADSDLGLVLGKELSVSVGSAIEDDLDIRDLISLHASTERFLSSDYMPSWRGLCRLIDRNYWRRAWVVQETAVARSVLLLCGNTSVSWDEFKKAVIIIYEVIPPLWDQLEFPNTYSYEVWGGSSAAAYNLVQDRELYQRYKMQPWAWLGSNRTRHCKLDHDKIYSILALTSEEFRSRMPVDYSQPIERLLSSVVKISVEESHLLDIVLESQHSIWHPELPSWVPDWRLGWRMHILHEPTKASTNAYACFSSDMTRFTVKAAELGVVTESRLEFKLMPNLTKSNSFLGENGRFLLNPDSVCHWYLNEQELADIFIPATALWRIEDIIRLGFRMLNVFLKMLAIRRNPTSVDLDWQTKTSLPLTSDNAAPLDPTAFGHFADELTGWLRGRTVVATEGLLALAPDFAEPGDVICWLMGCSSLVILRPVGDGTYRFIGDVFVESQKPGQDSMVEEFYGRDPPGVRQFVLV